MKNREMIVKSPIGNIICFSTMALIFSDLVGCADRNYLREADQEALSTIAERAGDERWKLENYSVAVDERSRFYDDAQGTEVERPTDDEDSNGYMHRVDGYEGWEYWDEDGVSSQCINEQWQEQLTGYVEFDADGNLMLNVDTALKLAYIHSPEFQRQKETLYLAALDVTAERFRLNTQYFGGYDTNYRHRGTLNPAGLGYDPSTGNTIVYPASHGRESNRLTLGDNPTAQLRRRFDSAGDLVAGFANSFVFEFTGDNADFTSSIANFAFVQPLLRGAGKHIALEQLTQAERNLLAAIRAYSQYRQGFFTRVTIGESAVTNVRRGSPGTFVSTATGNTFVSGFYGLLQSQQQVRNTQINLRRQRHNLEQFEELLDLGLIGLDQVDRLRQNVASLESQLLDQEVNYKNSIENYQTTALGLPPSLSIELDKSLIKEFTFFTDQALAVEQLILDARETIAELPEEFSAEDLQAVVVELEAIVPSMEDWFEVIATDVDQVEAARIDREARMPEDKKIEFEETRRGLQAEVEALMELIATEKEALNSIKEGIGLTEPDRSMRNLVIWRAGLSRLVDRAGLAQAQAKLERISLGYFEISFDDALAIALHNRLDFKNARASLVDTWRQIKIRENQLLATVNLTAAGDLYTSKNNPVSFQGDTGSLRFGIQFDAPITRLLERNALKQSLITYQQDKRQFIQSQDRLNYGLRALLRRIEMLRVKLEVDRGKVAIAIRQVDSTQSALYRPVRPAQPGQTQRPLGETMAINIVYGYNSLNNSQSDFLNTWMQYQAALMRLQRELGIMQLDEEGRWIDQSLPPVEELLQELEEVEEPTLVEPELIESETVVESEESVPSLDEESATSPVETLEDSETHGFEGLAKKLSDLQQRIEDAVLARAKARMDTELDRVLSNDVATEESENSEATGELESEKGNKESSETEE